MAVTTGGDGARVRRRRGVGSSGGRRRRGRRLRRRSRAFAGDIDHEATRRASAWPGRFAEVAGAVETSRARRNRAAAAATTRAAATILAVEAAIQRRFSLIRTARWTPFRVALERVEMPLVPVLASMEAEGVPFAPAALESQTARANARLLEIEAEAEATPEPPARRPSLASSADAARVLFEDLALPRRLRGDGRGRDRGFEASASEVPDGRRDPPGARVAARVPRARARAQVAVEVRGAAEELVDLARVAGHVPASRADVCVRLRGTIHQTNTETGRLAMEDPNLQTLPHPRAIPGFAAAARRAPRARPATRRAVWPFAARSARPPAECCSPRTTSSSSCASPRHFSKDEALLAAFANDRHDPFDALASRLRGGVAGDAAARPSEKDRAAAKRLAYAALFGGGVRFAAETGIDEATAVVLADTFKASIPGMERWRAAVVAEAAARTPPHVVTLGGRRRRLPGLAGRSSGAAFAAEARKAVNTTCQGSAADIVKRAMLDVFEKLTVPDDRHGAPSRRTDASDADADAETARAAPEPVSLVLQVHDELVFELDEADAVSAVSDPGVMERASRAFSCASRYR